MYDWIEERIEIIADLFGEGEVVINGTLGLWDGKHTIYPVNCPNIISAIERCLGRDCEFIDEDDLQYDDDNHVVNVKAHHHDGTNCFVLSLAESNY